jgi:hypothetical protein
MRLKPAADFKDPVGERVRALNYLETVLSVIPAATDRLESWFARPVVKCLRNMGIITLGDLVRFINVYGYRWYSSIKGFGCPDGPHRSVHWLMLEQDHLNLLVSANVHEPKSKRELAGRSLSCQRLGRTLCRCASLVPERWWPAPCTACKPHRPWPALRATSEATWPTPWVLTMTSSRQCLAGRYQRKARHPALLPQGSRAFHAVVRPGTQETPVLGQRTRLPAVPRIPAGRARQLDAIHAGGTHRRVVARLSAPTQCRFAKTGPGDSANPVWRPGGCGLPGGQPDALADEKL